MKTQLQASLYAVATLLLSLALSTPAFASTLNITMVKNKGCLCCEKWANSLKTSGFNVKTQELADVTPIKDKEGVPRALRSCHTAMIDGYVFEGHVPADLILKVLKDKPKILGLAAPGMPLSAPGMDIPGASAPYQVIAFTASGQTSIYAQR
jgi:hypothetical protein